MPARSNPWSARAWLPNHVYAAHVHHISPITSRPCNTPTAECSWTMNAVTCVAENTYTRSNSNSNIVGR